MKFIIKTETKLFIKIVLAVLALMVLLIMMGCATAPKNTATHRPMYTITNTTSSVTTTVTNGVTNSVTVANASTQNFLKPKRQWSLVGLVFGEKDPIPTTTPSARTVNQGPYPTINVEQQAYPYGYNGYYNSGGYGYPYRRVYYGGGGGQHRVLFGYRFKSP